jgi:phosphoglucosamine mutase
LLQLTVPGVRAQLGIALDGDGDRVMLVDSLGRLVDGDQILYILACARQAEGSLKGPVVGTLMSNFGLELALRERGIGFERAAVGDRYVLARLKETGGMLGGETSGHILCLDRTTTGDGLISALQVMAIMQQSGKSLAELAVGMQKFPQILINCKVGTRFDPMQVPAIRAAADAVTARLGGQGRVLLRASGTEPLVRVMVEGRDPLLTKACADELAELVQNAKVA